MENNLSAIGYLKYSGSKTRNGVMAARDAADALLGLDEIVRYFVITENPSLENKDFEIPVLVNKGSCDGS